DPRRHRRSRGSPLLLASPRLQNLEVAAREAGSGRCASHVSTVLLEDFLHVEALELLDDLLTRAREREVLREHVLHEAVAGLWRVVRIARGMLERCEVAERQAARDGVAQLADVAGPIVGFEVLDELGGEGRVAPAELAPEVARQERDVARAAPQRRQLD